MLLRIGRIFIYSLLLVSKPEDCILRFIGFRPDQIWAGLENYQVCAGKYGPKLGFGPGFFGPSEIRPGLGRFTGPLFGPARV